MNISDSYFLYSEVYPSSITEADSVRSLPGFVIQDRKSDAFPFVFIEKNKKLTERTLQEVSNVSRKGKLLPEVPFQADWILLIIMIAAFLYTLLKSIYGPFFSDFQRFFLFRGAGDSSQREQGNLFQVSSTLLNLVSFINISLFIYATAEYFSMIPGNISGPLFWVLSLAALIVIVTIRHIISYATGLVSGQTDAFIEYIHTIYQSYRYSSLFMFIILFLVFYATFLTDKTLIVSGIFVFAGFYLLRIIRLIIIFITHGISLFYMILYLCALEILPAAILIKFLADVS